MRFDFNFRHGTGVYAFYSDYIEEFKKHIDRKAYTLPIAAAYNAGYDEGYKKARNELWHTLQTKND